MTVRTFSGTHDFDPTVLADTDADEAGTDDDIIWAIETGRCPRCWGPLPTPPELPAGLRITECRSIPICGPCGSDEAYQQMDAAKGMGWGLSAAGEWPVYDEDIEERRARYQRHMRPAILTADWHLVTEDGSMPITNPRNTGGWAQYGMDGEERHDGDG